MKRPVIVFIHGGSWSIGSGNGETDVYAPDNYMDRDIVFVTMNYRLATLGNIFIFKNKINMLLTIIMTWMHNRVLQH